MRAHANAQGTDLRTGLLLIVCLTRQAQAILFLLSRYFDALQPRTTTMDSSTSSMPPATNALDAAFVNTAFSQQSPHGDSALPYGIPHGSAAVHAAGADSKPPDIPMGVADDKTKEKRIKREGGWSGSPAAKGQNASAGASTPVPVSPRGASPSKGHKGPDGIETRLLACH